MKNIETRRDGDKLVITIDLSQEHGPSASGKTTIIASTGGNKPVANLNGKQVYLGLNAYVYADER